MGLFVRERVDQLLGREVKVHRLLLGWRELDALAGEFPYVALYDPFGLARQEHGVYCDFSACHLSLNVC